MSTYARIFAVALAACSSSTSPGSVSGPIKGKTFVVNDALVLPGLTGGVEIVLTSTPDECVPAAQQVQHPNETALLIVLADYDPTTHKSSPPTMPGTYSITSDPMATRAAIVEANILDAMCINDADNGALADGGTVQLTGVDAGTYSGTFDVVLDSGDHVTGSFDGSTCSEPRTSSPPCVP